MHKTKRHFYTLFIVGLAVLAVILLYINSALVEFEVDYSVPLSAVQWRHAGRVTLKEALAKVSERSEVKFWQSFSEHEGSIVKVVSDGILIGEGTPSAYWQVEVLRQSQLGASDPDIEVLEVYRVYERVGNVIPVFNSGQKLPW